MQPVMLQPSTHDLRKPVSPCPALSYTRSLMRLSTALTVLLPQPAAQAASSLEREKGPTRTVTWPDMQVRLWVQASGRLQTSWLLGGSSAVLCLMSSEPGAMFRHPGVLLLVSVQRLYQWLLVNC